MTGHKDLLSDARLTATDLHEAWRAIGRCHLTSKIRSGWYLTRACPSSQVGAHCLAANYKHDVELGRGGQILDRRRGRFLEDSLLAP